MRESGVAGVRAAGAAALHNLHEAQHETEKVLSDRKQGNTRPAERFPMPKVQEDWRGMPGPKRMQAGREKPFGRGKHKGQRVDLYVAHANLF